MISTSPTREERKLAQIVGLLSIFAFYVLLRVVTWTNTVLLEDHDSVLYLRQIEAYLTFDSAVIFGLSPDSTPFYPFFGALFSLPGLPTETAARLTSLVFSIVLFGACLAILMRITCKRSIVIGLLVLSVTPFLISFSISILSEPTYVGIVYAGLAYLIFSYKSPSLSHAIGLGFVFGLSFLNRTEGLMFLILIPFLKLAYEGNTSGLSAILMRRNLAWVGGFIITYAIVAVPQIAIVSAKMGRFALNGRQVWADLLFAPDAQSYEAEIYGLDHDPAEINLTFLQHNVVPDAQEFAPGLSQFAETVLRNIDMFYVVHLGKLGGALLLALALFGLLRLIRSGKHFEAATLAVFVIATWAPGLLAAPIPRAMAIAIPCLAILAGIGIVFIAEELASAFEGGQWARRGCIAAILASLAAVWSVPFFSMYLQTKTENIEYSLPKLREIGEILDAHATTLQDQRAVVTARKQYLSYLTDTDFAPLPFTDLDGLMKYCELNGVNYIFLQDRLVTDFPFRDTILREDVSQDLQLVYSTEDSTGSRMDLYYVR